MAAKIDLDLSLSPRNRKVVINDQDITKAVVDVTVHCSSSELPVVELTLIGDVTVTSDGAVVYGQPLPALDIEHDDGTRPPEFGTGDGRVEGCSCCKE